MWAKIIASLTGQTVGAVIAYKQRKLELKQQVELKKIEGKIAYEEAKTRRAEQSEGRDHEWELESIRNSGWKDEWVLVVLSIPMILVFIPQTQPYILTGFESLATTPLWYRTTVMTIYLATFGLRLWRRDMNKAGAPSITS